MRLSEELYGAIFEMSARDVRKKLRRAGCIELRQKGSHVQVSCPPDLKGTVPVHGKKDIKKGTLKAIEKSLQIDLDGDGKPRGGGS
jgi:predicted RNA binding protein YcfA (HicA-like mRNA interferase family)